MKTFACIVLLAAAAVAVDYYDAKFDSINVDEIISNKRILNTYTQCFLNKGICTGVASEIKELIAGALKSTCSRCSPKQVVLLRKLDDALRQTSVYDELMSKYDPSGTFRGPFRKFLVENSA